MDRIPDATSEVPSITTEQMIIVDRLMIEGYRIDLIQMMENAGRCLAIVAMEAFLKRRTTSGKAKAVVLAGPGGNGGGALVGARRLHNWGIDVCVYLSSNEENMTPIPQHQLSILKNMKVLIRSVEELPEMIQADLLIDGLVGYSLKGAPYGLVRRSIDWLNAQQIPVLSLDTPSGIELTNGEVFEPAVKAAATLTLALPKKGLLTDAVRPYRGTLYLGDIGVPPALYDEEELDLTVSSHLFADADVVRIPN